MGLQKNSRKPDKQTVIVVKTGKSNMLEEKGVGGGGRLVLRMLLL